MNISHPEMVKKLVKSGQDIKKDLTAEDCNLIHAIMGICSEAGELLDTVKKSTIYRKPLDKENLIEECGDLHFYLEQLQQAIGVTTEQCLAANINKLSKRYPNFEYTNQKAQERLDKIGENK
jgi:NTP pyrophosphatase (non-canonical NTP hydrolase)